MKHLKHFVRYITEGKNIAELYHFTSLNGLLGILTDKGIKFSTREFERVNQEGSWKGRLSKFNDTYTKYISTTRHRDIGKVLTSFGEMPVRITLNGPTISNNYKIVPIDFIAQTHDYGKNKTPKTRGDLGLSSYIAANAFEERIISPRNDDKVEYLALKHIVKIDIFSMDDKLRRHETGGMKQILQLLDELKLPYEINLHYPKPEDKVKSPYLLDKVKGVDLDELPDEVKRNLTRFIAATCKQLGSENISVLINGIILLVKGDLPYYKQGSKGYLMKAIINPNGLIQLSDSDYDEIHNFEKLHKTPRCIDNYMNDEYMVYQGKDLKVKFNYTSNDGEVSVSNILISDSQVFKETITDIMRDIIPRTGYIVLPHEFIPYKNSIQFEKGESYEFDESNPNRINAIEIEYKEVNYNDFEDYDDGDM